LSLSSKNIFQNLNILIVRANLSYSVPDTTELTKAIHTLKDNRTQIENIISAAFNKCNIYLKNDSLTFYIIPTSLNIKEIVIKMGGVTGLTAGSKQILITINPEVNTWKETLEYTVAHEFNHAYWTNINFNNSSKQTLIEYLVFEGKADSFAHILYSKVKAPWTYALSQKEKVELWNKIRPNLNSENDFFLGEVMFGSKNYPIWGGYTLGFDILQTAFKSHPELTKTNWTNLDANKILEMSNYK
jgi:uncharacterized protein YjaZ